MNAFLVRLTAFTATAIDPATATLFTIGGVVLGMLGTMLRYSFKAGEYKGTKEAMTGTDRKDIQETKAMVERLHERLDEFGKAIAADARLFEGRVSKLEARIFNGGK